MCAVAAAGVPRFCGDVVNNTTVTVAQTPPSDPEEPFHCVRCLDAAGVAPIAKLGDVDAPGTCFRFVDPGLRLVQPLGKLALGQPRAIA